MPDAPAYVAGIGVSQWSWPMTTLPFMKTKGALQQISISAGTKALLDAGVSYDDVDVAIGCGDGRVDNEVFYTFGKTGIPIHDVDSDSGIYAATHFIKSGDAHCVVVICVDQYAAVGIIFASEAFLWRHPYLKDAAVAIRGCAVGSEMKGWPPLKSVVQEAFHKANIGPSDIQIVESNAKSALDDLEIPRNVPTWTSQTTLSAICKMVWILRGWTESDTASTIRNCLQCAVGGNGTATATVLSRADGEAAPAVKDVEHKNDGRNRLGYNPAIQTEDISMEDWESVKSRDEYSDERAADKVRFRRKGGDRAALAKF